MVHALFCRAMAASFPNFVIVKAILSNVLFVSTRLLIRNNLQDDLSSIVEQSATLLDLYLEAGSLHV